MKNGKGTLPKKMGRPKGSRTKNYALEAKTMDTAIRKIVRLRKAMMIAEAKSRTLRRQMRKMIRA